ncbi:MAG: hypothetical protein Q9191_006998, partial [Dirinaria sp. TL-2023a]
MTCAWAPLIEQTLKCQAYWTRSYVSSYASCEISKFFQTEEASSLDGTSLEKLFYVSAALHNLDHGTPASATFMMPSTLPLGGLSRYTARWSTYDNVYWILHVDFVSGRHSLGTTPERVVSNSSSGATLCNSANANLKENRIVSNSSSVVTVSDPAIVRQGPVTKKTSMRHASADSNGSQHTDADKAVLAEQSKALFSLVKSSCSSAVSADPESGAAVEVQKSASPVIATTSYIDALDLAKPGRIADTLREPDYLDLALDDVQKEDMIGTLEAIERGRLSTVAETLTEAYATTPTISLPNNSGNLRQPSVTYCSVASGESEAIEPLTREPVVDEGDKGKVNICLPPATFTKSVCDSLPSISKLGRVQKSPTTATIVESPVAEPQTIAEKVVDKEKKLSKSQKKRQRVAKKRAAQRLAKEQEAAGDNTAPTVEGSSSSLSRSCPDEANHDEPKDLQAVKTDAEPAKTNSLPKELDQDSIMIEAAPTIPMLLQADSEALPDSIPTEASDIALESAASETAGSSYTPPSSDSGEEVVEPFSTSAEKPQLPLGSGTATNASALSLLPDPNLVLGPLPERWEDSEDDEPQSNSIIHGREAANE